MVGLCLAVRNWRLVTKHVRYQEAAGQRPQGGTEVNSWPFAKKIASAWTAPNIFNTTEQTSTRMACGCRLVGLRLLFKICP